MHKAWLVSVGLLVSGGIVFVVLIAGATSHTVRDWFTTARLSLEVPDIIFTTISDTHSELIAPSLFGFKAIKSVPGLLVSVAPGTDGQILVWKTPDSVYTLEAFGKVLATSTKAIATPALSPSGTKLAYAMVVDEHASSSMRFPLGVVVNPEPWFVYLIDMHDGTQTNLGPGFSPVFKDDTTLLRITRAGVFESSIVQTGHMTAPMQIIKTQIPFLIAPLFISKNGSLIAWYEPANRDGGSVRVYEGNAKEFTGATYVYLQSKPDVRRGFPEGIHVTERGIYTLVKEHTTGTLWKYEYNGVARPLYSFSSLPGTAIAP